MGGPGLAIETWVWAKREAAVPRNKANRGNREVTYDAYSAFRSHFSGTNAEEFAGATPRGVDKGWTRYRMNLSLLVRC